MTALELQRALATMNSRAAQTLAFRCIDRRTPAECAALYGIGPPQWELLFLEAARILAGQAEPLDDQARKTLAPRLCRALDEEEPELEALVAPLRELIQHRDEVRRLTLEAEEAAARSPARSRETWLRRIAVVVIIAVSLLVWLRDKDKPPEPAVGRTRPTAPDR